jgi:hypothetical protein
MGIAMDAIQIASPGYIPDNHGFFIDGELKQVGGKITGFPPIAKGIGGFNGSAIEFGYTYHVLSRNYCH